MKRQEMATNGRKKWGARQEAVAVALARGLPITTAAAECRVGERTIHTWLADADFRCRVEELRAELFGQAVGRLCDISGRAVDVLGKLLDSKSEQIRLQAARSVLDHGPRLREVADLAIQLAELRRQVEEETKHGDDHHQAKRDLEGATLEELLKMHEIYDGIAARRSGSSFDGERSS
jgi:hypothetical protein